jgi:hypothetical protein
MLQIVCGAAQALQLLMKRKGGKSMSRAMSIPQEPIIEENSAYPEIDEYAEIKGMIVKWLEDYRQLEPLLKQLCSQVADNSKSGRELKLVKKI